MMIIEMKMKMMTVHNIHTHQSETMLVKGVPGVNMLSPYLHFSWRLEICTQTIERKLCSVPQLVAEETITLYTKDIQVDVTT